MRASTRGRSSNRTPRSASPPTASAPSATLAAPGFRSCVATHVNPPRQLAELLAVYRGEQAAAGHHPHEDDVSVLTPVFVHPDPARLRQLVEPGVRRIRAALRRELDAAAAAVPTGPAGDASRTMISQVLTRVADLSFDTMTVRRMALFDAPAGAADQLRALSGDLGAGRIICWFNPGGLIPHRDVVRAMERLSMHGLSTPGSADARRPLPAGSASEPGTPPSRR